MEVLTKLNLKCTKIGTITGDVILPDVENAESPVKIAAVKDIPVKVYDGNSYYLNGCLENGNGAEFGCLNVGGLGVHGCLNVIGGSLCVSGVVTAESITAGSANFTCNKAVEFSYPPKYTGEYIDSKTGAAVFNCSDQFITKCYVDVLNTCVYENLDLKANASDVYTKTTVDTKLAEKADKATTLSGYGIDNAYTKTEVNTALATKANKATTLSGYCITDAYTKTEVDGCLATKANAADVYTQEEVTNLLKTKADYSHTHSICAVEGLDAKLTCLSGCKVESSVFSTHTALVAAQSTCGHVRLATSMADTCSYAVPTAQMVNSTLNSHTGTKATTTTFGHVRLATGLADSGDHAVPRAQVVKDYLTNNYYTQSDTISCICVMIDSHNTWCTAHSNLFSQKADVSHTHAISDVTDLQTTLDDKLSLSYYDACTPQTIKSPLVVEGGIVGYAKSSDIPDVSNYLEKTCTQIGMSASAGDNTSIAIGCNAVANSHFGISIGTSSCSEENNIAIGQNSYSWGKGNATSIGQGAYSYGCGSLAIGCNAKASGLYAVAVGSCSESLSNTSISIGFCSTVFAGAENSISIGRNVRSSGVGNISIGQDLNSSGCLAIAIGLAAGAHGCSSIAIGNKTGAYQAYSIAIGDSSSASCANSIVLSSAPGGDSNGTRTFNVFTGGTGTCTDSNACSSTGLTVFDTFYYNGHSLGCILKSEIPYCSTYSISSSSASTLDDGRKYIDVTIAKLGTQNSNICTTSAYIEVPVNASVYATTGSGTSYSGSYIYPEITWSGTAASKASCVRLIFDEEMLTENSTVAVKVSGIRNS